MKHKILLLYSWLVRSILFFVPDTALTMRFRGFLYSLGMKKAGKNFQVAHNVILNTLETVSVGDNVYIAPNTFLLGGGEIVIEKDVLLGPNVVIVADNHKIEKGSFRFGPIEYGTVFVGRGAWVAANCTLVAGAYLPPGSVLAANSCLNARFEKNFILLGGVPAKLIKPLF